MSSAFWTLVLSLVYGHYLFFFTGYKVYEGVMAMYCCYSYRQFVAFYEMNQDGYSSFAYFNKPLINNVQYLKAFEQYDVDTAYREFRGEIKKNATGFMRSFIKHCIILFLVGIMIFPTPVHGFGVVAGYYVIRLIYRFIRPYGISTGLCLISNDFVRRASLHAYGLETSMKLLERQPDEELDGESGVRKTTLLDYIAALNKNIWREKNCPRTIIIWTGCLVPFILLPTNINNQFISEMVGLISLIYFFFPLGYLVYKFQIMDFTESVSQESSLDVPRKE